MQTISFNFRQLHMKLVLSGLIVILSMISLTACQDEEKPEPSPAAQEQIDVQLSWLHSIEFAAFYMAEAEGEYKEQNLEINLLPLAFDAEGNEIDPVDVVLSGDADFGVIDGMRLLEARENGKPVVAIAAIYQQHPLALVSLAEKEITTPDDLRNAVVHISGASTVMFEALLRAQAIDPDEIQIVERTDYTIGSLLNGEAEVIDGWVINEIVHLKAEGQAYNMILPSDYGIEAYPNVIFTTEAVINENPDLVQRFLSATIAGMQGAVDQPDAAAQHAVRYSESSLEVETLAMQQSLPLLAPADSKPGMMNAETWNSMYQILLDQGLMTDGMDVSTVYTLQFLNQIYESTGR